MISDLISSILVLLSLLTTKCGVISAERFINAQQVLTDSGWSGITFSKFLGSPSAQKWQKAQVALYWKYLTSLSFIEYLQKIHNSSLLVSYRMLFVSSKCDFYHTLAIVTYYSPFNFRGTGHPNIEMPSYQDRITNCKETMVSQPSYVIMGTLTSGKTLYREWPPGPTQYKDAILPVRDPHVKDKMV